MRPPTISSSELAGIELARQNNQSATDWEAINEEGDVIATLPAWCTHDQALELLPLVMAHEKRGRIVGERIGAMSERERITYGFRIALAPLTDALQQAAETAAPVPMR